MTEPRPELLRFWIHGYFHAENIDDAFARLGEHFRILADEDDEAHDPLQEAPLELHIQPQPEPERSTLT